jgi:integrase
MTTNTWQTPTGETIKYMTDEELERFFSVIRKRSKPRLRARDLAMFNLMLYYGLRLEEVTLLRLEHLNLLSSQLFVTRVKGKTHRGKWYDLSHENLALLKDWLKLRAEFKDAEKNPFLFVNQKSGEEKPFSKQQLYGVTKAYAKQAGVDWVHPHAFRHTCGVRLARAGFNAFAIRDRLGHSSVLSTQIYVELAGPDRAYQSARMDEALKLRRGR